MIKQVLTPKQVADAIGVSEASLKRWCDKGLIPATRTAGGHRRLPISGVVEFLRSNGQPIVRPEVLGLPSTVGQTEVTLERSRPRLQAAFEEGDEEQVSRILLSLYFAGHSIVEICDKVLAPIFHELGHRWENGRVEVYQERRSCVICISGLYQLRSILSIPGHNAPTAIGATMEDDPYSLACTMVAVALREAGWNAECYGSGHPADTLCAALRKVQPRLFWLSVSTISSPQTFIESFRKICEVASSQQTAIVLGGRALTEQIRKEITYSAYCDNLAHLIAFARTVGGQTQATSPHNSK